MPNKFNSSKRHHIPKQCYKVGNWCEYKNALRQRGRLGFWINDDVEECLYHPDRVFDGTGSSQIYTDTAILICHEIIVTFRLPLRQTERFINSPFDMAEPPQTCTHYSLLSKRLAQLDIKAPSHLKRSRTEDDTVAIAIDSTGLKRYGRDEWHQEKHQVASKASWRKLHLGVGDDHYIYASLLTDKNTIDYRVVEPLCEQIQLGVNHVSADKMYDDNLVYETLENHFPEADVVIPIREGLYYDESHHPIRCRNQIEIAAKGKIAWQRSHQYGKRNVSEMAMQRYKRTFGNRLHARELANQKMETMIACGVLNRFTGLGMPKSYRVT